MSQLGLESSPDTSNTVAWPWSHRQGGAPTLFHVVQNLTGLAIDGGCHCRVAWSFLQGDEGSSLALLTPYAQYLEQPCSRSFRRAPAESWCVHS